MKKLHFFFLIFGLIFCVLTSAQAENNTYQVELPFASGQNPTDLFSSALQQLLVNLTGNSDIQQIPAIQTSLSKAETFVQTYQFKAQPNAPNQRIIVVTFNQKAVKQLLQNANQPIQPPSPPQPILVWMGYANPPSGVEWMSPDEPVSGLNLNDFMERARLNHLNPVWPALDLNELSQISASGVENDAFQMFRDVSKAYGIAYILVGIVRGDDTSGWKTHWLLLTPESQQSFSSEKSTLKEVYGDLFTQAQPYLKPSSSVSLAPLDNSPQELSLIISNVNNLEDYASISKALQALPGVIQVQPSSVRQQTMNVNLKVQGGINQLLQALQLDPTDPRATETPLALWWQNQTFSFPSTSPIPSVSEPGVPSGASPNMKPGDEGEPSLNEDAPAATFPDDSDKSDDSENHDEQSGINAATGL